MDTEYFIYLSSVLVMLYTLYIVYTKYKKNELTSNISISSLFFTLSLVNANLSSYNLHKLLQESSKQKMKIFKTSSIIAINILSSLLLFLSFSEKGFVIVQKLLSKISDQEDI